MTCSSCGSERLGKFESEISIRFSRLKDIEKRPVMVLEEVSVPELREGRVRRARRTTSSACEERFRSR
jgi:hypothetical protein